MNEESGKSHCELLLKEGRLQELLDFSENWKISLKQTASSRCDPWFYIGKVLLLRGDSQQAEINFTTALSKQNSSHFDIFKEITNLKAMVMARDKSINEIGKRGIASLRYIEKAIEIAPLAISLYVLKAATLLTISQSSLDLVKIELNKAMDIITKNSKTSSDVLEFSFCRPATQYARILHRSSLIYEADYFLDEVCTKMNGMNCNSCTDLLRLFRTMDSAKSDANEAYNQGRYLESLKLVSYALTLDPMNSSFNAILYSNRAAAHFALGNLQNTVDDCDSSLSLSPNFSRARIRRARALLKLGRVKESIADFETALKLNPSANIAAELSEAARILKHQQPTEIPREYEIPSSPTRPVRSRSGSRGGDSSSPVTSSRKSAADVYGSSYDSRSSFDYTSSKPNAFERRTSSDADLRSPEYSDSSSNRFQRTSPQIPGRRYSETTMPPSSQSNFSFSQQQQQSTNEQQRRRSSTGSFMDSKNNPFNNSPKRPPRPNQVRSTIEADLYTILGVSPQASHADIKKAYHREALKHHPDKNVGDDEAGQRFKKVVDAFTTLSDPLTRRRYDLTSNSLGVYSM